MSHRSNDKKLQEIQKALAASSLLPRAHSEVNQYLPAIIKANITNLDFKVTITLLKVPLSLMGNIYSKLADRQDDLAESFSWDAIRESPEALQKENKMKGLLEDSKYIKPSLHQKRKHESTKYRTFQKF